MAVLDENKANELLGDDSFVKAFSSAETTKEMVDVLKEYDIETNEEDLNLAINMAQSSNELSESDLEDVSGGVIRGGVFYWLGYLVGRLIRRRTDNM